LPHNAAYPTGTVCEAVRRTFKNTSVFQPVYEAVSLPHYVSRGDPWEVSAGLAGSQGGQIDYLTETAWETGKKAF